MSNDEEIKRRFEAYGSMRAVCFECFKKDYVEAKERRDSAAGGSPKLPAARARTGTLTFVCETCGKTERGAGRKVCNACAIASGKCELCGGELPKK